MEPMEIKGMGTEFKIHGRIVSKFAGNGTLTGTEKSVIMKTSSAAGQAFDTAEQGVI